MKKLTLLIPLLAVCGCVHGATIITSLTNWDQTLSTPSTNSIVIQQVGPPLADGTRLVVGLPHRYANTGSGSFTNVLNMGAYQLLIEGIVLPHPIYFAVPNSSSTYFLTQNSGNALLVSGGNFMNFTPGVLSLSSKDGSVVITPSNGVDNVDLSVAPSVNFSGTNSTLAWLFGGPTGYTDLITKGQTYDLGLGYNLNDGSFGSLLWYSAGPVLHIPNGVFAGDGAALLNLDAGSLTTGTVDPSHIVSSPAMTNAAGFIAPDGSLSLTNGPGYVQMSQGSVTAYGLTAGENGTDTPPGQGIIRGFFQGSGAGLSAGSIPMNAMASIAGSSLVGNPQAGSAVPVPIPTNLVSLSSAGLLSASNFNITPFLSTYNPRTNGSVFFVATNGVASGPGTTPATAWSLSYALAHAGVSNTLVFLPGTNYGTVFLSTPTLHNGLALIAQTKGTVRLVGTSALHNIEVGNTVSNVVIDGLEIGPAGICCIKFDAPGKGGVVRECFIHDAAHGQSGWVTNGSASFSGSGILCEQSIGMLIEKNLIERNGAYVFHDHGLYISGTNNVVRANILRYNLCYGFQQFSSNGSNGSRDNYYYNNLIYGNDTEFGLGQRCITLYSSDAGEYSFTNYVFGNLLGTTAAASGEVIDAEESGFVDATNNIFLQFSGDCVIGGSGATVRCDYNLSQNPINLTGGAIVGSHNVLVSGGNFGFINAAQGLYYPSATSPARGAALSTAFLTPTNDFWGRAQTSISDIGPFQFSSVTATDKRILDPSSVSPDGTAEDPWAIAPYDSGFYMSSQGGRGNLNTFTNPTLVGSMQRYFAGSSNAYGFMTAVNALDFGLNASGADQTAYIQAAINSVTNTGGNVYIPAGTYRVGSGSDVLRMWPGVNLIGEAPSAGTGGNATVLYLGSQPGPAILMAPNGKSDIKNIIIQGNGQATGTGIQSYTNTASPSQNYVLQSVNFLSLSNGLSLNFTWDGYLNQCGSVGCYAGVLASNQVNGMTVNQGHWTGNQFGFKILGLDYDWSFNNPIIELSSNGVFLAAGVPGAPRDISFYNVYGEGCTNVLVANAAVSMNIFGGQMVACPNGTNIVLVGCDHPKIIGVHFNDALPAWNIDNTTFGLALDPGSVNATASAMSRNAAITYRVDDGTNQNLGGYYQAKAGFGSLANNQSSLLSSNVGTGTWSFTNTEPVNWLCYIMGGTTTGVSQNDSAVTVTGNTNIDATLILQPNEWLRITNSVAPRFTFKRF